MVTQKNPLIGCWWSFPCCIVHTLRIIPEEDFGSEGHKQAGEFLIKSQLPRWKIATQLLSAIHRHGKMCHGQRPKLQRQPRLNQICSSSLQNMPNFSFHERLWAVNVFCWSLMSIPQFTNRCNEFTWVVCVHCSNFILVWQKVVECRNAWLTGLCLTRIDMTKLCVNIFHHQSYRLTFDTLFHIGFQHSMICNNVVPKSFCIQSFLPPLFPGRGCHHPCLLANLAERIFGVVTKLVVSTTCLSFKISGLPWSDVLSFDILIDAFVDTFLWRIGRTICSTRHGKQLHQIVLCLEFMRANNFTCWINHWNKSINIEKNHLSIRSDEIRLSVRRPHKTVSLLHASNPNWKNCRSFIQDVCTERFVQGINSQVGLFISPCGPVGRCKTDRHFTLPTVLGVGFAQHAFANQILFTASVNQPHTLIFWCRSCKCWQMGVAYLPFRTNHWPTVATSRPPFLVTAFEAASGLLIAVKELDDLVQLACKDLSTVRHKLVSLWDWFRIGIAGIIYSRSMLNLSLFTSGRDLDVLYLWGEHNCSVTLVMHGLCGLWQPFSPCNTCIPLGNAWRGFYAGLLLWRRAVWSFRIFGWCCSFLMFIETFVTSTTVALLEVCTRDLCHLFLWEFRWRWGSRPTSAFAFLAFSGGGWSVSSGLFHMFVGAIFTLFTLSIPKLITDFLPFLTASTRGTTITFSMVFSTSLGRSSRLRFVRLFVFLNDSVSVWSQTFSVQQVPDTLQQKCIGLLFWLLRSPVKSFNVILHECWLPNLSQKDIPKYEVIWWGFHSGNGGVPSIQKSSKVLHTLTSPYHTQQIFDAVKATGFLRRPEVIFKHQKYSSTSYLDTILWLFIFEVVNLCS